MLLGDYDGLRGINWRWQSIDRASTKAPLGGNKTGPNPTHRGTCGTQRHVLTDQRGAPLRVGVTRANRHHMKALPATLDRVVIERPAPRP
jgi:putative transposase